MPDGTQHTLAHRGSCVPAGLRVRSAGSQAGLGCRCQAWGVWCSWCCCTLSGNMRVGLPWAHPGALPSHARLGSTQRLRWYDRWEFMTNNGMQVCPPKTASRGVWHLVSAVAVHAVAGVVIVVCRVLMGHGCRLMGPPAACWPVVPTLSKVWPGCRGRGAHCTVHAPRGSTCMRGVMTEQV